MLRFANILDGIYKGARIILFGTGYYCNYVPSCSEYALKVLKNEGFFKATFKILKRLILCNFLTGKKIYFD